MIESKKEYPDCTTISHIVNPVIVPETSDLYIAQPITFESMRIAKKTAMQAGVQVKQYAAFYLEDRQMAPDDFIHTPCLDRSVMDVMDKTPATPHRRLPLIRDILERLYHQADSGYLIYTNVDIGLKPDFYIQVHQLIQEGYDALIINRRTIPKCHHSIEQLPEMYKESGKKHPGQDCFVFKREVFPRYILYSTCIGSLAIGKVMAMNMMAHAVRFNLFTDLHISFHIGEDRVWAKEDMHDYRQHNLTQAMKIYDEYLENGVEFPHPLIKKMLSRFRPKE